MLKIQGFASRQGKRCPVCSLRFKRVTEQGNQESLR